MTPAATARTAAEAHPRERLRQWLLSGRPLAPAHEAEAAALVDAAREQRLVPRRAAGLVRRWGTAVLR